MGRYSGKSCRLLAMLALTLSFMLVEVIVGHMTHSLALIADAFHMLSDTLALIVGLTSVKLARRGCSKNNTYGWARAEVVGALINAVFLLALCFTILVEAIERLISRESITDATNLLYVGGVGLVINILGLLLFHTHAHGHTHGGMSHNHSHNGTNHNHSHNGHNGHTHKKKQPHQDKKSDQDTKFTSFNSGSEDDESEVSLVIEPESPVEEKPINCSHKNNTDKKAGPESHQLNMRGVFLHMLGDALGSVFVMISAGVTMIAREHIHKCHVDLDSANLSLPLYVNDTEKSAHCLDELNDPEWVKCIDPILSLVLVAIILSTAIPLLKQTAVVLMQMAPSHLRAVDLLEELREMDGVIDIHEFHIWSLAGNKVVASLHVHTKDVNDYVSLARRIKNYLHVNGIHSVTIQPEFSQLQSCCEGRDCALECGPDMECHELTCCGSKHKHLEMNGNCAANGDAQPRLRSRGNSLEDV